MSYGRRNLGFCTNLESCWCEQCTANWQTRGWRKVIQHSERRGTEIWFFPTTSTPQPCDSCVCGLCRREWIDDGWRCPMALPVTNTVGESKPFSWSQETRQATGQVWEGRSNTSRTQWITGTGTNPDTQTPTLSPLPTSVWGRRLRQNIARQWSCGAGKKFRIQGHSWWKWNTGGGLGTVG